MRRLVLAAAALALAVPGAAKHAGIVRSGGGSSSGGGPPAGGGGHAPSPPVVIKMRDVSVPRPHPIERERILRDERRRPGVDPRDEHGDIHDGPIARPPSGRVTIVRNPSITREVISFQNAETRPRYFYWHTVDGVHFCHYYDVGVHWYGFYDGPSFYWTRYYGDRWWWYDPNFDRWVYWHDGYWWWQPPGGATYVYVDNNYYPYEAGQGGVTVKQPQTDQPPPESPPAHEGVKFASPDGRRMVQVFGERREAFLYETPKGAESKFLKYLAKDVKAARFSRGKEGAATGVMLDFNDGSFALYDLNGNPLDVSRPEPSPWPPPAPPPAKP